MNRMFKLNNKHLVKIPKTYGFKLQREIAKRIKAEELLVASLREREVLLREIYHRTGNNMQVICSMLKSQSKNIKDKQALEAFKEVESWIRAMALAHGKLFHSKDLSRINLKGYIEDLVGNLFRTHKIGPKRISLIFMTDDILVSIDTAIPCGLAINELISNSLKFALLSDRKSELRIGLHKTDKGEIELRVCDNGVGIPKGFEAMDANFYGLQMVTNLIEHQLNGKVDVKQEDGVEFLIKFKDPYYTKRI